MLPEDSWVECVGQKVLAGKGGFVPKEGYDFNSDLKFYIRKMA